MSDNEFVRFHCPVCDGRLATKLANVDLRVQCPECISSLIVPEPLDQADGNIVLYADEAPLNIRSDKGSNEAEMDMTPMVDVTFLLLIFFMVTAAFTMQKSFQVPTPQDNRPSENVIDKPEEEGVIRVRVDEFSSFHVFATGWDEEVEAPSEQELRRKLREAKEGDGQGNVPNTLIVEAHVDANHEKVILAMDLGTEFEMENVKLQTIEGDY